MVSNTGCRLPGELEMTRRTSAVAVCCSSALERCPRASASSRVRASSCSFNSINELDPLLTRALAFVPVERSLRPRVGPLRDKITSSALPLVPPFWSAQPRIEPVNPNRTARGTRGASFDHLVGTAEKCWRHLQAKHLGGLEVYDEFVRLRRQVCRLNLAGLRRRLCGAGP